MRRLRGEDGAYAILYAVLVVILVGMTSVVIDLGMLRNDRRENRSAADSAAIAAAAKLGLSGQNPYAACLAAVHYARADLGMAAVSDASITQCSTTFGPPFDVAAACTTGAPKTAVVPLPNGRFIHITWPVPDGSPLMQDPDHERWKGFDLTDQSVSSQDGGACLRVGVAITQDRNTPFAAVWGDIDATRGTVSHSVGLAAPDDGPGQIAAPLVVLDEHTCNALLVTGGGSVTVKASALVNGVSTPGVIAVDSDGLAGISGTPGEEDCNGGRRTIRAPSNVNHIWAVDGTSGKAYISSYAMAVGNTSRAYDPAAIANCTAAKTTSLATLQATPQAALCPIPTPGARVGEEPWILRYNCDESARICPQPRPSDPQPSPRDYVNQWVDYATDTSASAPRATWGTIAGTNRVSGGGCNLGTQQTFTGPTYVDCDKFTVTSGGKAAFLGPVIFRGDVDAAGGTNAGCILFNDPDFTHCTNPATYVPPDARTTPDGGNVYIGGGFIGNGNNPYAGALIVNQVFIYVQGRVNINTSDPVDWVAPYGEALPDAIDDECTPDDPATTTLEPPDPACFDSLGLWAPTYASSSPTQNNQLLGGARLVVDGTLFMPKAYFRFGGQGANFQDRAQFVTRRLEIAGGGELSMVPDGSRSTLIPRGVGVLIR